ncbi:MAG: hypothetical protein ACXWZI_01300 [Mycobacterium sp.]
MIVLRPAAAMAALAVDGAASTGTARDGLLTLGGDHFNETEF